MALKRKCKPISKIFLCFLSYLFFAHVVVVLGFFHIYLLVFPPESIESCFHAQNAVNMVVDLPHTSHSIRHFRWYHRYLFWGRVAPSDSLCFWGGHGIGGLFFFYSTLRMKSHRLAVRVGSQVWWYKPWGWGQHSFLWKGEILSWNSWAGHLVSEALEEFSIS